MFRFNSKTQWQMFLLLYIRHVCVPQNCRRTQTRFQTKLYKFVWHNSVNNAPMKNSRDVRFGKVVYIAVIYCIPDSWFYLLNGYNFYFWSHDWWKPRIVSSSIIIIPLAFFCPSKLFSFQFSFNLRVNLYVAKIIQNTVNMLL